ncbi:MAG: efflux RND transporter permease subunit, partial [Defluviitaleaceae bacterium]|nr:efflux RND transporter permease subunit [Defluviitaleaceae bacterium]
TAPLGTATFGDLDLATRIQVRHDSLDDLRRIPIILPTGGVIRVDDVANVQISAMDASSISRYNGDDTITITIQNPQAVSANATSDDVIRTINAIMADNPEISIAVIHDNSEMIADSLFSVAQTLVLAIVLAMVILYLFLGDLRASLIVGSSMPISLLVTFIFMDFMGYTLNIVTMSGLIIGVGMMVDNAIVVIDSCFRARKEGRTFKEAAVEGTRFVMLSIIAVTLTTVVVFVPLATVQGLAGQMFAPIGFSIVFALVASLLSAVSLVPLFFFQFKPIERSNAPVTKLFNKLENGYANLLTKILNKKKTVLAITGGIMALAVFLATFLNFELMPPIDEGIININITTRPGLNLERTDEILVELEGIVSQHPDVSHFILTSGAGGTATLTAHLLSNRNMQTSQVIDQWWQETRHVLDVDINISSSDFMGMGAMGDSGIPIVLEGETLDVLRDAAAMVEDMMLQHPDIIRVNSTFDRANPQAEIVVDPLMAAFHGITPQMVTGSVFIALNGSEVAEITMDSQRFAVRVEYPRGRYETVNDVANMMVMSGSGALVPLSQISTVEFTDTPQTISRQNNMYTATITAVPLDAARFTAQAEIQSAVAGMTFPEGIQQGRSLDDQMMDEELAALGVAIITAILLVFMVMAIQFESIRHSLMVMVCVPLAVIGSLLLMVATGVTISMVSLLGFLVLIGLVVNNGILFVDTTNKYRQQKPLQDALIHAGRTRLRPIMMITLTSVLAMLPLALGFGDDTMQGLGVTVIGGLTASTALALLFLPTFYLIIDGNSEKREERRRLRTEKREQKIEGHI